MPTCIAASQLEAALLRGVTAHRLEEGRKGHRLFVWRLRGRKCDRDSLFKNSDVLLEIITTTNSMHIDKTVLVDALKSFDQKTGFSLSNCPEADIATQSYAIKSMLMSLLRVCRQCTTGARLAPWLLQLVRAARQCPDVTDTEGWTDAMSTTEYTDGDHIGEPTPKKKQTDKSTAELTPKKSIFLGMPSAIDDDDDIASDVAPENDGSPAEATKKPADPSFIYGWNDVVGATKICPSTGAISECTSVHKGATGYIVCMFVDELWQSEEPNLTLDVLADIGVAAQADDESDECDEDAKKLKKMKKKSCKPAKSNSQKLLYSRAYKGKMAELAKTSLTHEVKKAKAAKFARDADADLP